MPNFLAQPVRNFRHVSWGLSTDEGVSTPRMGSRPQGRGLAPEEGVSAFDDVRVGLGSQRGEGGVQDSNLRVFISLAASSRTKAFGCHSAFAASILPSLCTSMGRGRTASGGQ
jgi:hypothetical protein